MSTKKKVQFSDKKKYNKYDREESGSESGGEQGNYSDEDANPKKAKHSLDSDEEDNTEKYKILNKEVFKGIEFDLFCDSNCRL